MPVCGQPRVTCQAVGSDCSQHSTGRGSSTCSRALGWPAALHLHRRGNRTRQSCADVLDEDSAEYGIAGPEGKFATKLWEQRPHFAPGRTGWLKMRPEWLVHHTCGCRPRCAFFAPWCPTTALSVERKMHALCRAAAIYPAGWRFAAPAPKFGSSA